MLGDAGSAYGRLRPGETGPGRSGDLLRAGLNPVRGLVSATALPFGCCLSSSCFLNFQKSLFRCLVAGSLSVDSDDWAADAGSEKFLLFNSGAAESLDSVDGVFVLGWMALMEGSLEVMLEDAAQSMGLVVED